MGHFVTLILTKILTPERIAALIARLIANLLTKARATNQWDRIKAVIAQINNACNLFAQVYDDDTLSADDEAQIAQAIAGLTSKIDIAQILR